jgi:D-sedoheptulose 7-phosphate isomerase
MSNNDIKKNLESSNFINFSKSYLNLTKDLLDNLDLDTLENIVNLIEDCSKNNNTIYVAGNGGSASTASTFVNDIGFDVYKRSSNQRKIKIVSLNDNIPSLTAISNDINFDSIFKSQLEINFQLNDILIVFSGSGNSKNLINAVDWINDNKMGKTVGFLGFDGGKLGEICEHSIVIKSKKGLYGPIEDLHLTCNHIISLWLQSK